MIRTPTAAESFRASYARALLIGLGVSVAVHLVLLGTVSLDGVLAAPSPSRVTEVLVLPPHEDAFSVRAPAVRLPARQTEIARPAKPTVVEAEPAAREPRYIPHDVAPVLVNPGEIRALLRDGLPADIEVTESGASVVLWLFVDGRGEVEKLQLRRSSGDPRLDRLAQSVARAMKFRPALHLDEAVAVWVAQTIRFARDEGPQDPSGTPPSSATLQSPAAFFSHTVM